MASNLRKLIDELGLRQHADTLLQMSKPSIELLDSEREVSVGCSKFGGLPDVPLGFKWPLHELGEYRFIGQFNLEEAPSGNGLLPTSGLLSVFHAHDDAGEIYASLPHYVRAFYFARTQELRPQSPPAATRSNSQSRISFELNADIPPWPLKSPAKDEWPLDESYKAAHWELRCKLHPSGRYLLGFPFNTTLCYDPTPGAGWTSLLTLSSDDDMGWNWGDGDWLVVFIEEARMKQTDFTNISADEG